MLCAVPKAGDCTEKGTAGESRCRKAAGLNAVSRATAGPPNKKTILSRVRPDERKDFLCLKKKFAKRFLTWALTMVLTVSLLPLGTLASEVDSDEYEADSYDLEQPKGGIQINAEESGSGKTIPISKGKTDHCTAYYIEGPEGLEQFLDKDLEDLPDLPVFSNSISHSNVTAITVFCFLSSRMMGMPLPRSTARETLLILSLILRKLKSAISGKMATEAI